MSSPTMPTDQATAPQPTDDEDLPFWKRSHFLDRMTLKGLITAYFQHYTIIAYLGVDRFERRRIRDLPHHSAAHAGIDRGGGIRLSAGLASAASICAAW